MGKSRNEGRARVGRSCERVFGLLALCLVVSQTSACRQASIEPPAGEVETAAGLLAREAPVSRIPDSRAFADWSRTEEVGATFLLGKREVPGGACELLCGERATGKILWAAPLCPSELDVVFASEDCRAAIVLWANPVIADAGLAATEFAEVLRDGKRVAVSHARGLLDSSPAAPGARRVSWIAGVLGKSGNPPRRTADGKGVELEVVGGGTKRLGFDGSVPLEPVLEGQSSAGAPRTEGMLSYVDGAGNVVYVADESEIPAHLRHTARALTGQISVQEPARREVARHEPEPEPDRNPEPMLPPGVPSYIAKIPSVPVDPQALDYYVRTVDRPKVLDLSQKKQGPVLPEFPEPSGGRRWASSWKSELDGNEAFKSWTPEARFNASEMGKLHNWHARRAPITDQGPVCKWAGGGCAEDTDCCGGKCVRRKCQ